MFGSVTTAAQLMVKVGADVEEAQSKLRGMSNTLQGVGKAAMATGGLMTVGLTLPLVAAATKITQYASDLSESSNKVSVVFGEQAAAIQTWAQSAATSFGMTKQQALESSGTFGNLFSSMNMGAAQSAQMSQGLVQLAGDLASFNNIDPGVALEKLRAGLVGEAEPLRTLGVNLTAAATEAQALKMGLATTAEQLTEADKATARYALILEQTKLAQGDFARTSDGLANGMRIVKAQFTDAAVKLGEKLLPYVTQFVQWISGLISAFTNLDPQMQTMILAIGALAAAIGPVVAVLGVVGTVLGALISPIGLVVAAIVGLGAIVVQHFGGIQGATQALSDLWTNTLQPALAKVWAFIQDNIIPILKNLLGWLQDNLPAAIAALAEFWTNTLQPALAAVWSFIQDNIIPILQTLLGWLQDNLPPALEGLRRMWEEVLLPAINAVWSFIDKYIVPLLKALAEVWIALVKKELEILAGIFLNVVKPALEKVWQFIDQHVIPILKTIATVVQETVGPALQWFTDTVLVPVAGAIDAIGGAIEGVIGWLQRMADKINSIKLPDWLTPGSPTPFELGLLGINRALRKTADDGLPAFKLSLKNLGTILEQIVEVFRQLAVYFADPTKGIGGAKAVTDALAPIFDNITAIVDGLQTLVDLGDLTGISAKIDQVVSILTSDLPRLLQAFVDISKLFKAEALAAAVALADAAGKMVAPLKAMADGFAAITGWVVQSIEPILGGFMLQLRKLARSWIVAASIFDEEMLAGALWFASVAGTLVAPLKAMADGFAAVAGWVMQSIEPILGGFILQLRKLTRQWVAAAALFDEDMLAGALWFASVAGTLVAPLKAMADGFAAVAGWVMQSIEPILGGFMLQLRKLARAWIAAASIFDEEMLAGALWFAGIASKLVAPIKAMVDAFTALSEYVSQRIGPTIDILLSQLSGLARKFVRAASQFDEDIVKGALWFAGIASKLVAPIKAMVDAFTALSEYVSQRIGPTIDILLSQLSGVVRKFVRVASQFDQDGLKAAIIFADAVRPMVATISDALDLLTKIKTYVSPSANALLAFERDVEDMLTRFVRWVVFVVQPIADKLSKDAMIAMQEMITGLQAALELLNGLVDYVAPSALALTTFMDGVEMLALNFMQWAQTNGPQLFKEIPPEFLAAFRDVFEGLQAAVDVLTSLVDFVAPSVIAVIQFEEGYQRLFMDWLTWVQNNFSQTKNDLLIAIAGVFSEVMTGLQTAVDVLTSLVDFVAPSVIAVIQFEEAYQRLFRDWVTWATGTFADINTELVTAVASVFSSVFEGIGAAVATLVALQDYVSPSITAITAFETDYQRLFSGFVTWVEITFTDISSEVVVAMAGAAGALFQGLGAAATTLTQITGYIGPTDATITAFETDYQRIATDFRNWAQSSWTTETAATTTAVGNAVNALFQGLGMAATTLSLIRNYTAPSQAVVDRFIADMTNVMGTMLTWVQTSFGPEAQQIMTGFGNTTQTLFSGIGTALTTLQGIADYTVTDSQFRLALQRFNANLLTAITSWQIWLTNTFTPETAALVQQFHTILSGIVADMGAALNLLMNIDQANLPTADELLAFLNAVVALFDGVIAMFGGVTGQLTDLVQAMADAFQEIFDTIEIAVSDFGSVLYAGLGQLFSTLAGQMWAWGDYAAGMFMSGLLAGMQNINSQNAVIAAMRDLADQLEAELRAAWGIGSPSKVAERIGGYFVSGLTRGLEDLNNIPSMIQRSLAMDGVTLGTDVRYSPAPRHDYLTIEFQGAYQAGMSPAEERRITSALVGELRRQGVALQVARV